MGSLSKKNGRSCFTQINDLSLKLAKKFPEFQFKVTMIHNSGNRSHWEMRDTGLLCWMASEPWATSCLCVTLCWISPGDWRQRSQWRPTVVSSGDALGCPCGKLLHYQALSTCNILLTGNRDSEQVKTDNQSDEFRGRLINWFCKLIFF